MSNESSTKFQSQVTDIFLKFISIHELIEQHGVERGLAHLIMLRVSQINQCGFCVEMHTREARQEGESNERLDQTVVFRQSGLFSQKEKLALEWSEKLTDLDPDTEYASLRNRLLEHYSEKEVSALTALVAMINTWNRIRISEH